mmetsp:Transcript_14608/g.44160  ORF Transcript_14608/g.44160 Transcript_14608/m.44160 type:complete len:251 (+) Transcript_14608:2369-3121(+)
MLGCLSLRRHCPSFTKSASSWSPVMRCGLRRLTATLHSTPLGCRHTAHSTCAKAPDPRSATLLRLEASMKVWLAASRYSVKLRLSAATAVCTVLFVPRPARTARRLTRSRRRPEVLPGRCEWNDACRPEIETPESSLSLLPLLGEQAGGVPDWHRAELGASQSDAPPPSLVGAPPSLPVLLSAPLPSSLPLLPAMPLPSAVSSAASVPGFWYRSSEALTVRRPPLPPLPEGLLIHRSALLAAPSRSPQGS